MQCRLSLVRRTKPVVNPRATDRPATDRSVRSGSGNSKSVQSSQPHTTAARVVLRRVSVDVVDDATAVNHQLQLPQPHAAAAEAGVRTQTDQATAVHESLDAQRRSITARRHSAALNENNARTY